MKRDRAMAGFTLIELLTALLVLSLLALMSFRGLDAVLLARAQLTQENEKWRHMTAFLTRFEQDVHLAAPRPVRTAIGTAPAWSARADAPAELRLAFSRFATVEGVDRPRRIAYRLNEKQEIELWLWPSLDMAPASLPARYPLLSGVAQFELQYLNTDRVWLDSWPAASRKSTRETAGDITLPRAVKLRIVLTTGEEVLRVIALNS